MTGPQHPSDGARSTISLHRLRDVQDADQLIPGIDRVFFAASCKKSFENAAERVQFRARWLGRYLDHDPDWVYVALAEANQRQTAVPNVVGYLVAALDDPARAPRFADLGYFQVFKQHTARYPAQLHVNLAQDVRGAGLGRRLVAAFIDDARQAGCRGVHVVTGARARNVTFYQRAGFNEVARTDWNGHTIILLGLLL